MYRVPVSFTLALLGVLLVAGTVCAQKEGPPPGQPGRGAPRGEGRMMGGMGPGGGSLVGLLRLEQVQKELNLTADQKEKVDALAKELREKMQARMAEMRSLSEDERKAKMPEMQKQSAEAAEKVQKQLGEILKPEQMQRLKEIGWQADGPAALSSPEVAKALGLSEDQRDKIKKVLDEGREQAQKAREAMREAAPEERMAKAGEMREKMEKIRKEVGEKAMQVLTAEQREKFEKMKGKKVDLSFPGMGPRGSGGGGRGPRDHRGEWQ